jgi:hypothetical protein
MVRNSGKFLILPGMCSFPCIRTMNYLFLVEKIMTPIIDFGVLSAAG